MARQAISKKLRFEVFKRDSFTCQYCGAKAPEVVLNVDHIEPVAEGGTNDIINLVTACKDCNAGKRARRLSDDTVVRIQRKQSEESQEFLEQARAVLEWQRTLIDVEAQVTKGAADIFNHLIGDRSLNENGEDVLRKYIKKHGVDKVVSAMRASVESYLRRDYDGRVTDESVEKCLEMIPRIINVQDQRETKPYLKDIYYIRGILRNRFTYVNEKAAIKQMEQAYEAGVPLSSMKSLALEAKNWTEWHDSLLRMESMLTPKVTPFIVDAS